MTVMVTGASGPIGHALVPLLVRTDEVRAAVRRPDAAEPLRALGAKVAVGRLDDADELAEVLRRVYTVIHLVGGPSQPDADSLQDANHGSVLRALAAAKVADVRRFVLVSVPGASPDAPDAYRRARGLAEEAVINSGLDHAVIRSTHAYGLGGLWLSALVAGATASPPVVLGDPAAALAPVAVEDVAAVLAAADDREGDLEGTWALEGPDATTPTALIRLLAGETAPEPRRVAGDEARASLEPALGVSLSNDALTWLADPARADAPDAAAAFDVPRTPLLGGLRRALERAAVSDELQTDGQIDGQRDR
ncbi:MAG: SDR family oxidoreductase [Myxococcota bacterium]